MEKLIEFLEELRSQINELIVTVNSFHKSDHEYHEYCKRFVKEQGITSDIEKLKQRLNISTANDATQCRVNILKETVALVSETSTPAKEKSSLTNKSKLRRRKYHCTIGIEDQHSYDNQRITNSGVSVQTNPNTPATENNRSKDQIIGGATRNITRKFNCSFCKKIFKSKGDLGHHLVTHSESKEHLCGICGKAYKTSSHLKEHVRIHTGEKPFVCSVCGKAFTQAGARKAHERGHKDVKQFNCDICNKSYKNKCSLKIHMRQHSGTKPFKCSQCNKAFSQQQALTVHSRTHSGERPYLCNVCGKSFSAAATYRKHRFSHQSTTPYHCEQCGKYFTTNTKLKRHESTHKKKVYVCEYCKGKFRSELLFKAHTSKCQANKLDVKEQNVSLKRSAVVLPSKAKRNTRKKIKSSKTVPHELTKTSGPSPPRHEQGAEWRTIESHYLYKCLKCGYHFPAEESLNQHQLICVGRTEATIPCSCSSCGTQFTVMSDLLNHLAECYPSRNTTNSTDANFQDIDPNNVPEQSIHKCYECKIRFSSIEELERHYDFCVQTKSIDLSNVPYKCAYCGNLYINMQELSKHESACQEAHDTNLTCTNCLIRFSRLELLTSHQSVCPKAFNVDKVTSVRCIECNVTFNSQEEFAAHQTDCSRMSNVELSYCNQDHTRDIHFQS